MAQISTSACVPYTAEQMFALVNDVAAYPRYVPLCSAVKLRSVAPERLVATMTFSKGKIKFDFTTENSMRGNHAIDMRLVDGPFKYLNGTWGFVANPHGGSDVSFTVDFEFSNALLTMAFGGFFKNIAESMVGAFCEQAALRYGSPDRSGPKR
ncbi:type II toxin-antitoxin system RatA family toxin [Methylococcus sp. EFPC2]|uniref:type II toxin-antitoxin system RatA family toxin n=1 Tax=Methylococcus sp. EFPC2 TaxID=2812648 RepID=UPI0019676C93|nr:type II toxin-antitoxin system RatA family toxin [Methylococcus sp. EFPC2]QSA95607.1 type II toxin-antitoxin system RatA family toxin [Methylococcus sp. EFPC2]